ncbi:MAG: hypothetical protein IKN54_08525, partial [Lachnospiraceae bacterium]|nr:hypothetical protein [Lachnospiraceae bacterium]
MEFRCGDKLLLVEDTVREYSTMLYRVALLRLQNDADAQEVVQDTFLRLLSQIKKGMTFSDKEHLKAWLLTVAVNRG